MIRREEESQLTAATVKLAKLVTGVTLVHNIAQQKKKCQNILESQLKKRLTFIIE